MERPGTPFFRRNTFYDILSLFRYIRPSAILQFEDGYIGQGECIGRSFRLTAFSNLLQVLIHTSTNVIHSKYIVLSKVICIKFQNVKTKHIRCLQMLFIVSNFEKECSLFRGPYDLLYPYLYFL